MNTLTATYDPADNKLRLRSALRLDRDLYGRVRSAGFIWAPKQELFVAPMWTPDREDLLLELCEEIGDEDTGLVERAEQRADRFADYSSDRAQDAEKIESGMRRVVRMWDQSQYWKERATGAIRHAKYKERPDVRARRIKGLEADKRKQERGKAEAEQALRFWRGEMILTNKETGAKRPLLIVSENRAIILRLLGASTFGHLSFEFPLSKYPRTTPASQYEGHMGLWSALGANEGEDHAVCTLDQARDLAIRSLSINLENRNRWLAHYENRLMYERAMLAEDGGTATDRKGPEKDGACVCWVSRGFGGWCYIQKVNKVSVTVLDNWGNGGSNFTRTVPFTDLKAIMSAAEVQAARDCGTLVEVSDKTGFVLRGNGNDKQGQREDNVCPDGPACPDPVCQAIRVSESIPIEQIRETLEAGIKIVSANQLFPTPTALANRVAELAELVAGDKVLEPSAGTGQLVKACLSLGIFKADITAVEINRQLAELLKMHAGNVIAGDFLEHNGDLGTFDKVLLNPPFSNGQDIKHIRHALTFLNPGGRLVAICANGPKQQEQLAPLADEWIDLEPGAFAESGTNVNAAIIVINRLTPSSI